MLGGLIIAAPASGSGKTTITLALLRALSRDGVAVAPVKIGPDYLDPAFHQAASGQPCINIDPWAMRMDMQLALANSCEARGLVIAEGVMGLFDGASAGGGSTADLAVTTGWPVVLVVDAKGMAASAAAVVHGFATYRDDVKLEGVIFNRIGSPRHGDLLRKAVKPLGIPVLGCVTRNDNLSVPHRHLGLVQALEHPDLEGFMDRAAVHISDCVDLGALRALAKDRAGATAPAAAVLPSLLPPLGQRIWVADDAAFAFTYRAVIDAWREAGAEVSTFSPLANEAPDPRADAVYLPGGYPELHADKLAANAHFLDGIRNAAARGAFVYGECGGYMVLGEALVDRQGKAHSMTGCLPVVTSFETPRLNLGYRAAFLEAQLPLGRLGAAFKGHEFHFAKEVSNRSDTPLFRCRDAAGQDLGVYGARIGSVAGSFIHLVDGA